jgi:hypothetical protein
MALKWQSHDIFRVVFGLYEYIWVWIGTTFWFLNFKHAPLIWDSHIKFWGISYKTFSEILKISEKKLQLSLRVSEKFITLQASCWRIFSENRGHSCQTFSAILSSFLEDPLTKISTKIRELQAQLPILLQDSKNLREGLAWHASKLKITMKNRETSLKFKNQKWFTFRPRSPHIKNPSDSPFKITWLS